MFLPVAQTPSSRFSPSSYSHALLDHVLNIEYVSASEEENPPLHAQQTHTPHLSFQRLISQTEAPVSKAYASYHGTIMPRPSVWLKRLKPRNAGVASLLRP